MARSPLKRNRNIQSFSHDHHHGLLLCWNIRQGLKKEVDPDRIKKYVSFFWDNHLKKHFELEELLLFKLLNDNMTAAGLLQHSEICSTLTSLNEKNNSPLTLLNQFADQLDMHIRFEERELFPHAEKALTNEQLSEIGERLNAEHTPFCDDYPDKFWIAG